MRLLARIMMLGVVFGVLTTGCVVKDTTKDDTRELRSGMLSVVLTVDEGDSATLDFTWGYLLGIIDKESIDAVEWNYSLREPRGATLARVDQRMREPDEDKTKILVVGDRTRSLEIPRGALDPEKTYILWFELYYRNELLGELLYPVRVVPGEQVEEPFVADEAI